MVAAAHSVGQCAYRRSGGGQALMRFGDDPQIEIGFIRARLTPKPGGGAILEHLPRAPERKSTSGPCNTSSGAPELQAAHLNETSPTTHQASVSQLLG
jgi:hypothetical protein